MASERFVETFVEIESPDMRVMGIQHIMRDKTVYGDVPVVLDKYLTVKFKRTGTWLARCNLNELAALIPQHSTGTLCSHVTCDPLGWAHIVSFLIDTGLLIFPSVRFEPLRSKGYALEQLFPAMENRVLVFHVMVFRDAAADYVVKEVRWNTDTQETAAGRELLPNDFCSSGSEGLGL